MARPRKIRLCKEENCQDVATTNGYCRFHYLKNWKKLQESGQLGPKKRGRKPRAENATIDNADGSDELERRTELLDVALEPNELDNDIRFDKDIDDLIKNIKVEDS